MLVVHRKYYKDVDGMMLDVGTFTKGLEVNHTVYLFSVISRILFTFTRVSAKNETNSILYIILTNSNLSL